ncbi:uncharacterized protein LOC119733706 [Patiria miniata]|uniref:Integrase core domain-containing protein n=1 Tax=Patiria miniata TaxID=46514 RepID=A0A914AI06_PATMI|nr:uncharacterized protein LOC119733706 [Patiria miniata]
MPVKNNLLIYDNVYRPAVLEYGMWDQVRVDHGTEFFLTLYMQEKNNDLRVNCSRQPYIQTKSTRNHKIERMWPEVNQRVNYPIKGAPVELTDAEKLDIDDSLVKFCVSTLCLQLCEVGVDREVTSWNAHRIPAHFLTYRDRQLPRGRRRIELIRRIGICLRETSEGRLEPRKPPFLRNSISLKGIPSLKETPFLEEPISKVSGMTTASRETKGRAHQEDRHLPSGDLGGSSGA